MSTTGIKVVNKAYGSLQPMGRGSIRGRRKDKRVRSRKKKKDACLASRELVGTEVGYAADGQFIQTGLISSQKQCDEFFGDRFYQKPAGTFRFAFHNIGRLATSANSAKSRATVAHIAEGQYDLLMMAEVGLCHCKLDSRDQWGERTVGILEDSSAFFAYNTTDLDNTRIVQYGGVGIVATSEARHRIISHDKDPTGLGRWVSVSLQGKEGHVTTFFSVYRPCSNSSGPGSVYMQQLRLLPPDSDPRQAIFDDLRRHLQQALDKGQHVVVGMDVNESVKKDSVQGFFASLGLREIILERHKDSDPPETQRSNLQRYPIDGIWASPSIVASKGGYMAYDEGIPSDHRCLWVDVQFSVAFGQSNPPVQKGKARRLKADDPRLVGKYVKSLKKLVASYKLLAQLQDLKEKAAETGWNATLEEKYNRIHDLSLKLRLKVERRLRKLRMGAKPWSPRLQVFRDRITLWEMMVRRRKKQIVSLSRIRRFIKKTGLTEAIKATLEEALIARDRAYKEYKAACSDAANWRDEYQESLIDALASQNNTSRAQELKKMVLRERQRRVSRQIKRARGKLGLGRVTTVYYKNPDGSTVQCNTKVAMEKAISKENEARFSQSEDTPPMCALLIGDMGLFGETDEALEVLAGTYPIPEELPKYTKEFLRALQKPKAVLAVGDAECSISVEEHCWAWRRQKERTSAEPTGPSFSHYKAAATDPILATLDCLIRELPYIYGFSPRSWRRITDVSILKKAGMYLVDKMRTIQLMHSEFNINNKKLGRDVMRVAEKAKVLPPDQYGSRKKHRSIMAALNKRLTMDILRQLVCAGALCAHDAKSCYDRIVHWVAVLCLCWAGLPREPAISMFLTLALATHYVSTAFGVAQTPYGLRRLPPFHLKLPFQGVGQGNGSGPAVWAVISSVLISMMYAAGHGVNFISPLSLTAVTFVCYAFVDDTDLVEVGKSVYSKGEDVAKALQVAVDRWEGGLRATGGALEPLKSHWYLIDFQWTGTRWEYRSCEDMPASLSVVDTCGTKRVVLTRHEVWHAEETLGVKLAMDGNNVDQTDLLVGKATTLVDQIRVSNLNKNDVWYAINSVIMPSLEYCLPAVTLSKSDWNRVLAPILRYLLPKAGYDRHFPRRILFAPLMYQGVGLQHPWHKQCIGHLFTLISECLSQSLTGRLLRTSLEACRLEAGVSGYFWDRPFSHLKEGISPSWIANLWSYTSLHKIAIRDPFPVLQAFWTRDVFLMDAFSSWYNGEDLRRLNHCRMFLKAVTLSDISTMDGAYITVSAWMGIPADTWNYYEWPRRPPEIPPSWWGLWKSALTRCFCKLGSRALRSPLGSPLGSPAKWSWYYSASAGRLYHQEGGLWWPYHKRLLSRVTRQQLRPRYVRGLKWDIPPNDLVPTRVFSKKSSPLVAQDGAGLKVFSAADKTTGSGDEMLDKVNTTWVSEWELIEGDLVQLAQAVQDGSCLIVSDGSAKYGRCTSAFTLFCPSTSAQIMGVNHIPGCPKDGDSFRGEVGGIAGALELVRWVCKKYNVSSGGFTLALDGEEALEKCSSQVPISPDQSSFDLLQVVHAQVAKLPFKITWQWVKGHQTGPNRSKLSILNEMCDLTAKAFWQYCNDNDMWLDGRSFTEGWQIWLGNSKLCSFSVQELYEWAILFDEELSPQMYWEGKHQLSSENFCRVDWDSIGRSMKAAPVGQRRWLAKFLTGFCGTNQMLHFRGLAPAACPRCDHHTEDTRHVVMCRGEGAQLVWLSAVEKLKDTMGSLHTDPSISKAIVSRLRTLYFEEAGDVIVDQLSGPVRSALAAQDSVGWFNFLHGRLVMEWGMAQQSFYHSIHRKNSIRRWLSSLIAKLWEISWDMWRHRNGVKLSPSHPSQQLLLHDLRARVLVFSQSDCSDWTLEERSLLNITAGQIAYWPKELLRNWLDSYEAIQRRVGARLRRKESSNNSMRKFLRTWLQSNQR